MGSSYWAFFLDHATASFLLLVGIILSAQVSIVRRSLLPASFLAGGLGLLLGSNGLGWLPFSPSIGEYPSLFVALVFATLPFLSSSLSVKKRSLPIVQLGLYSLVAIFLQWSLAVLFTSAVLRPLWSDLPLGFASLLAVGFVGGYGTAAAIGSTFAEHGWADGQSLAMTSATIGLLTSVVGGMMLVRGEPANEVGPVMNPTSSVLQIVETQIVRPTAGHSAEPATIPSSFNTLSLHLSIILLSALLGFALSHKSTVYLQDYRIPVFCWSFLSAGVLCCLLRSFGATAYLDRTTLQQLQGTFVDFLVVFGIASISFQALAENFFPLMLLLAFGIVLCLWLFAYLGPRSFSSYWFENALFTWGWVTGITGIAIALLRITDPQQRSRVLSHFSVAYVIVSPVEIALVVVGPLLLLQGKNTLLALSTGIVSIVIIFILFRLRRSTDEMK